MGLFGLKKREEFACPMTGIVHPMEDVPDPMFTQKVMGDGFAIELTGDEVRAPFSGVIAAAFPTGHAFGLKTADGTELLIHVGIDTVTLDGRGFQVKVKEGDKIRQGDILVVVDTEYIKSQGKSLYSPVVFTNGRTISLLCAGSVNAGDKGIIKIQ